MADGIDLTVSVEGLGKLYEGLELLPERVDAEVQKALYAGAQMVRTAAIKSLDDGDKSGRIYKRRSIVHQASAPGEAPSTDTGRLKNSITAYNNPGDKEAFTVAGRGLANYAPLLEFGTDGGQMLPRPFMFPALESCRQAIKDRINDAVRRALGKK